MNFLKNKKTGYYLVAVSALLSLVATIAYIIFGAVSHTFVPAIAILAGIATVLLVCKLFYNGFFSDYLSFAIVALVVASLMLLIGNSIDDLTAFFVGMGDYFGNADNVGPRVLVAVFMLLTVIVTIVSSFMKKEERK